MIPASDIKTLMMAAMDATNNDQFIDSRDYIPAINFSIITLVDAVNRKLGSNKFSEEAQRDLRLTRVFETSKYSRIQLPDTLWTLEAVFPLCTFAGTKSAIPAGYQDSDSRLLYELAILATPFGDAKRLSSEEWGSNYNNPFAAGYAKEPLRKITSYAYRHLEDYGSNASYNAVQSYTYDITQLYSLSAGQLNSIGKINIFVNGVMQTFAIVFTNTQSVASVLSAAFPNDTVTVIGNVITITSTSFTAYGDMSFQAKSLYTFLNIAAYLSISPIDIYVTADGVTYSVLGVVVTNLASIVTALNTLNIGVFSPSGNDIIITSSKIFSAMTIDDGRLESIGMTVTAGVVYMTITPVIAGVAGSTVKRLEIELRPLLNRQVTGISYVKIPTMVAAITDDVEFPESLIIALENIALIHILYKRTASVAEMMKLVAGYLTTFFDQFG